jgi:hypothetical protein
MLKWLGIEMVAVLLIAAYVLIDASDVYRWWVGDTAFATLSSPCNLHEQSCQATLKDGTVLTFDIEPKNIPLMEPLHFTVTTPHSLAYIDLKIFATNMNMGFHTLTLKPTASGVYEAQGVLPTCMVGGMVWQANVILNEKSQSLGAIFTFKTDK